MKVKVSKVMAKAIADAMKKRGVKLEEVSVVSYTEQFYSMNVGDVFYALDYGDYDWETQKFKAIRIVYPYGYYAMPAYLTTKRLVTFAKRCDGSMDKFMNLIQNEIEI